LANVPIRQIKELLNHADISQTVRYAKLQDEANKKAIQRVFFKLVYYCTSSFIAQFT